MAPLNDFYQVQTAASCPALREEDEKFYLIDLQAYCQCPGRDPPNVCEGSYCPTGSGIPTHQLSTVIDPEMGLTCKDTGFLMDMIAKQQDCEALYSTSWICCSEEPSQIVFESANGQFNQSSGVTTTMTMASKVVSFLVAMAMW